MELTLDCKEAIIWKTIKMQVPSLLKLKGQYYPQLGLSNPDVREVGRLMVPRLLGPASLQTQPDVVRQVRGMVTGSSADGLVGALVAMRDRPDSTSLLPAIQIPTLVVAGSDDQLIAAAEARAMADAIPGAQYAMIPGAGHLAPVEQSVNTSRVIREFLEALP